MSGVVRRQPKGTKHDVKAETQVASSTSSAEWFKRNFVRVIAFLIVIIGGPQLYKYVRYKSYKASELVPETAGFSFIIPARDEDLYLARTINSFYENSLPEHISEIILFDDASVRPVDSWIRESVSAGIRDKITVIRSDEKVGLIQGRINAARIAKSDYLFFVDGHCNVDDPSWAAPLLESITKYPERMVVPSIYGINRDTWLPVGGKASSGQKMMFDWTMEFYWLQDNSPEVPIMPGGIFAVDKKFYMDIGEFDAGMLEWGGENIELSIRVWTCGGEVYYEDNSLIGHLFDRPPKPNDGNKLVERVQLNHLRVARVWLDDYIQLFYKHHHSCRHFNNNLSRKPDDPENDLDSRIQLRSQLKCKPFQYFVDKFRPSFDKLGLIEHDYHLLKDENFGDCLTIDRKEKSYFFTDCVATNDKNLDQLFINYLGNRMLKPRNLIAVQALFDIHAPVVNGIAAQVNTPVQAKDDHGHIESLMHKHNTNYPIYVDIERVDSSPGSSYYPDIKRSDSESGRIIRFTNYGSTVTGHEKVDLPSPLPSDSLCIGRLSVDSPTYRDNRGRVAAVWLKCEQEGVGVFNYTNDPDRA